MTTAEKLLEKFSTVRGKYGRSLQEIRENRKYYNREFATDIFLLLGSLG